jgi:hypothetical protein
MFENNLKSRGTSEPGHSVGAGAGVSADSSSTGNGRVVHDSRGNAVWQWGVATGVFARIKSAELLNMLEHPSLALEGEATLNEGEWAGDPYNRR